MWINGYGGMAKQLDLMIFVVFSNLKSIMYTTTEKDNNLKVSCLFLYQN